MQPAVENELDIKSPHEARYLFKHFGMELTGHLPMLAGGMQ